MQIKQSLVRVAAAMTVTVAMTAGVVGPVEAAGSQGRSSQAGVSAKSDKADHSRGNASTQGDYDKPQPESRADKNDGGANAGDCEVGPKHSYCSTRDGSPSQNGLGDGEAKGKPCAGCVGKADNKFPQGQHPDGSDRNAGYECDRNNGIGRSNPAHTGCTGEVEEPIALIEPVEPAQPAEPVEPAEPAEQIAAGGIEVLGVEAERGAPAYAGAPAVAGAAANRAPAVVAPAAGILPATGAGAYGVAALAGIGLLAAGGVLLARRRMQLEG